MSAQDNDYFAPTVSEHSLDPGGNYVSPASDAENGGGSGTLSASIVE
jgi:hypothetical protein